MIIKDIDIRKETLNLMLIGILLSLFFFPTPMQGQNTGESLVKVGLKHARAHNSDSALYYFQKASSKYLSEKDSISFLNTRLHLAKVMAQNGNPNQALIIIDEVLITVSSIQETEQLAYFAYLIKAEVLKSVREWPLVFQALDSAVNHNFERETTEGKIRSANLLVLRAEVAIQTGSLSEAEVLLDKSLKIYEPLDFKIGIARIYYNLGLLKVEASEANIAISYLYQSKNTYLEIPAEIDPMDLASLNIALGEAYLLLELFPNAIDVFEEAMEIAKTTNPKSEQLILALINISKTHNSKREPEKGISPMEEASRLIKKHFGEKKFLTALSLKTKGRTLFLQERYSESIPMYQEGIDILKLHFPNEQKLISTLTYGLGVSHLFSGNQQQGMTLMKKSVAQATKVPEGFERKTADFANYLAVQFLLDYYIAEPDSALKYYHVAATVNSKNFNDHDPKTNPPVSKTYSPYELYRSLIGKAYAYELKFIQSEEVEWVEAAFNNILVADSVVSSMRQSPVGYFDEVILSADIAESLHYGIRVSHQLFQITKDEKYVEAAYMFFEKTKSNQAQFNSNTSKQSLSIPNHYIEEEKAISKELSSFETLLYNAEKKSSTDADHYRKRIFELNNKLLSHRKKIKDEYPGYYSFKYNNEHLTIKETQDQLIEEDEALISYNLFNSNIYSIRIDKSGYDFRFHEVDSSMVSDVMEFRELLKEPSGKPEALTDFRKYSSKLSKLLFTDSLDFNKYSRLTILPDGVLHLIPFEVLLTQELSFESNFNNIPYLIKSHEVRYATSATALARQTNAKKVSGDHVLAAAPLFKSQNTVDPLQFDSTRASMGNLAYTETEVQQISNHFKTKSLLDVNATEKAFRKYVSNYPIIHVASHGVVDEDNSLYSKLLFSPFDTDSINDGFLNTREILGLDIQANMVVLSACNTGSGDILEGEGVMSMANGFFYAGAKSLVMTLWTANDESTSNLMDSFYKNLADGQRKGEALRNAKLTHLENSDELTSHPYYWAHFVVNGDNTPISKNSLTTNFILGLIALSILLLIIRNINSRRRDSV